MNADPELTITSQINLIIISLPSFVREKFFRKEFENMEELMSMGA